MSSLERSKNLAYEIGLCRIALVVHEVHPRMNAHHAPGKIFHASAKADQTARLTYFWWAMLGGNRLLSVEPEQVALEHWAGISEGLFRDWLALFRQTALPIIGERFTRAWSENTERLAHKLLISDDDEAAKRPWQKHVDVAPRMAIVHL